MIISKTPMRISFFGGGTDFPDYFKVRSGAVISTSINKYCYVHLRDLPQYFEYNSEIIYSKIERVKEVLEIQHPLVREALKYKLVDHVHLAYDADLPARTGLATSSAFSVGLLNALSVHKGEFTSKRQLADEAIFLERHLCNEVGGIQDQIASSYGGLNYIEFDEEGYRVSPLLMSKKRKKNLQNSLMLFFTGVVRTSSDVQKAINFNKDETLKRLDRIHEITIRARDIMLNPDVDLIEFGALLDETWKNKRNLSKKVSTDKIDSIYDTAIRAGAIGGKLLGAGSGGFLLFYVPEERQNEVRFALHELTEVNFQFENQGSAIIYSEK